MSTFFSFFFGEKIKPFLNDNGQVLAGSIARSSKITIGGIQQWLLIRGKNVNNPILLFLHGGPGFPQTGLTNGYQDLLEEHFIVVNWDQRGAGKSYSSKIPKESMHIQQFVKDGLELSKYLLKALKKDKIYLVGHSWGTLLGIKMITQKPGLFAGYLAVSQMTDVIQMEQISLEFTLNKAGDNNNRKAIKALEKIGAPPYKNTFQSINIQRKWLTHFGGMVYAQKNPLKLIKVFVLNASAYNLLDKIRTFKGLFASLKLLVDEIMKVNIMQDVKEVSVPVYFFAGIHDYVCPSVLIEQFYNQLNAPVKELIWFEHSAHAPLISENMKFQELILEKFLNHSSTS